MPESRRTEVQFRDKLDYLLSPVLSTRRTAIPLAKLLAPMERSRQDFVLHWVEVIAQTNYEMAYQFAAAAPAALARLDTTAIEAWIIQAMDTYDRDGLQRGSEIFKQIATWTQVTAGTEMATFEEYAPVLHLFVCGLAGRPLNLDTASEPWTDTETLYLPAHIAALPTKAENFNVYKILATLLVGAGSLRHFPRQPDRGLRSICRSRTGDCTAEPPREPAPGSLHRPRAAGHRPRHDPPARRHR